MSWYADVSAWTEKPISVQLYDDEGHEQDYVQEHTCHMTLEPNSDRLWWCDHCEAYHEHESKFPWQFCPRCGAWVVDE